METKGFCKAKSSMERPVKQKDFAKQNPTWSDPLNKRILLSKIQHGATR